MAVHITVFINNTQVFAEILSEKQLRRQLVSTPRILFPEVSVPREYVSPAARPHTTMK